MKLIVIGSLLLSILASILFWGQTLGLNVFLFVLPVMCFVIFLLERYHKIKNRKGYWLILPILLLAITYMIYQNRFFSNYEFNRYLFIISCYANLAYE